MLTKKSKYALKALSYLATRETPDVVGVHEISEYYDIPQKFLNCIFNELKNSGYVYSKKGAGGGFSLAQSAHAITVGDILRATSGPLAPIPCASKTRYRRCDDCENESTCQIRKIMQDAQKALSDIYDNCTLHDLAFGNMSTKKSKNMKKYTQQQCDIR